jgi:hypothetical protein
MRFIWVTVLFLNLVQNSYAGDDASGPAPFSVDLSQPFTTCSMTLEDEAWSTALAARFIYKGRAIHFVRTSLPLSVNGEAVGAPFIKQSRSRMSFMSSEETQC